MSRNIVDFEGILDHINAIEDVRLELRHMVQKHKLGETTIDKVWEVQERLFTLMAALDTEEITDLITKSDRKAG